MADLGLWNWLIFIATIGGLLGMYLLTYRLSTRPSHGGEEQEGPPESVSDSGHVWDEDLRELHNPLPRWWVGLFYITLAFAAVYLVLYPGLGSHGMFLGWTQAKQYEAEMARAEARFGPLFERYQGVPVAELAEDPDARGMGERLFASYCTTCHGSDARGVPGFPNLRDGDWLHGGTPEDIETSILNGRTGVMPAWRDALGSDAAVAETVEYVLGLSGRATDEARAAAGRAHYERLCVACHGPAGKGNQQIGAPDLTDSVWLYGGSPEAIRHSVAEGRRGVMPAHGERLGPAKVHLLATYVYSLARAQ